MRRETPDETSTLRRWIRLIRRGRLRPEGKDKTGENVLVRGGKTIFLVGAMGMILFVLLEKRILDESLYRVVEISLRSINFSRDTGQILANFI